MKRKKNHHCGDRKLTLLICPGTVVLHTQGHAGLERHVGAGALSHRGSVEEIAATGC